MRIALSGSSGSGKSWVARYLVERHEFVPASTGAICRQISNLLFASEDKEMLNRIAEAIRAIDESAFVKSALRSVTGKRVVLDSVRYSSDLPLVRAPGFQIWRIDCPLDERARRLSQRGQTVRAVDLSHPSETDLDSAEYDARLRNFGFSKKALKQQIDELIIQ